MKKFYFLFATCLQLMVASAQPVALDFDGLDDKVTVPNASALIAGSNMSMSFWVYPTNPAPNYPNFDGMAGFRDNFAADFYILHLSSTTVEARFRNSSGTNYDINGTAAVNTWQHYVLTYNGSTLTLYRNGTVNGSVAATGTIASTTLPFNMGVIPFSAADFYLDGKLDDVTLWNRALTAAEVSCMYQYGVDTTLTGLQLYYSCDQNNPGGNNSGKTTLNDITNNIHGNLTGFTLSGNTSNWVTGYGSHTYINGDICQGDSLLFNGDYIKSNGNHRTTYSTAGTCDSIVQMKLVVHPSDSLGKNVHLCHGDSVSFGSNYLKDEGTFSQTFTSRFGCDSTSTLVIDVDTVQTGITKNEDALLSLAFTGTYQWYDCDLDTLIAGETAQSYTFPHHGSYAVIVTQNGCTDTSECLYTALGVADVFKEKVRIAPNPTSGETEVILPASVSNYNMIIRDTRGRIMGRWEDLEQGKQILNFSHLQPGVYFLEVRSDKYYAAEKLVKN